MALKKLIYKTGIRLLKIAVFLIRRSDYFPEKNLEKYSRLTGVIACFDDGHNSLNHQMSIGVEPNPEDYVPLWKQKVEAPAETEQ